MNMYNNLTRQPYGYDYYRGATPGPEAQTQIPMQSQPVYQVQNNYIKGRPVVSIDEAKASPIDLDGSLYVFPDLTNKRIYTKQINMDGTASFNVFELAAPVEPAPTPSYVTKEELDNILTQFKASLLQPAATEPPAAQKKLTFI